MDLPTRLQTFLQTAPVISPGVFIAPNATVIGAVELGENASIWFGAVLRGDINRIVIGPGSNVQDNAVVHLADDYPCLVGASVTVGHSAILHACTIGDEVLVGMGAIVLDGAVIGEQSIIGAGALVTGKTLVPPGSLVLGNPAKVVKSLSPAERSGIKEWAVKYVALSRHYLRASQG